MIKIVKIVLVLSGIAVIVIPIAMTFVWNKYITETQSQRLASQTIEKCTPHDFQVQNNEEEKLVVTWKTKDQCVTYLLLSALPNQFSTQSEKVLAFQGSTPTTDFMAHVPRAVLKESPYMVIVSNDILYGIQESAISVESFAK
ncbi:MAG: hypothetical protein QY314_00960 [Candidatus Dojkabacteria bacterium]|nr:MAG: hypothetical protein QY314_00960 [Candidatus Dojkabacteria bacterium]